MVYYQGNETVDSRGHFFQTGPSQENEDLRWSAIRCDGLAGFFADNLGAQILLLDVQREPGKKGSPSEEGTGDRVVQWPEDPHVAVLRYAWRDQPVVKKEEARLLTDLTEIMPQASRLKEVTSLVGDRFTWLPDKSRRVSKKDPKLSYDEHLPVDLADLAIHLKP